MSDDPYVYPGTVVLINKFGIRDWDALEIAEREAAIQRMSQRVPSGNFDLAHVCAIHRHLYQDIYDWAGKVRTINIAKGGNQFQAPRFIGTGIADIHRRLTEKRFLVGLSREDFAREAGAIIGDVNYVHPFREGNGHPAPISEAARRARRTPARPDEAGARRLARGLARGAQRELRADGALHRGGDSPKIISATPLEPRVADLHVTLEWLHGA